MSFFWAAAGLALLCGLLQACASSGQPVQPAMRVEASGGRLLGLAIGDLSPAQGREAGIGERAAVVVLGVAEGSRAAEAGLRRGDIVLAAQGRHLAGATALDERLRSLPAGGSISLRVWRQGGQLELVLDTLPVLPGRPGAP